MTPEELTGRLSNQKCDCKHNAKARKSGLCEECKKPENYPYIVFLWCKNDRCMHTDAECGYFYGPGSKWCGQPFTEATKHRD